MIKKVLFVLMPKDFQDYEFETPYKALCEKGFAVDVAGMAPGQATGKFGMKFTPNLVLSDLEPEDFDRYHALVIPGGPGSTSYLWGNKELQSIAWDFHSKGKLVAAICHACAVLAEAGLLAGKKATIFPSSDARALFAQHNVMFVDLGCVTLEKERIITAQSPEFLKEFVAAILHMLA